MGNTLHAGELYKHYKGNIYQIVAVAIHTETNEEMVIYQALYGEYKIYARPFKMFFENVCDNDGKTVARFTKYVPGDSIVSETLDNTYTVKAEKTKLEVSAENAETVEEEYIEGVNPMLIKFLDAESIEEKLEILHDMRKTVDEKTISDIAVAMDLVIEEGSLEDKIRHLEYYLNTRARFEASRLR